MAKKVVLKKVEDKFPLTGIYLKDSEDLVFTVYDGARDKYLAPFLAQTIVQAKRFIYEQINVSSTSYFALYPRSYKLFRVGVFDHNTGLIKTTERFFYGTFDKILAEIELDKGATNG